MIFAIISMTMNEHTYKLFKNIFYHVQTEGDRYGLTQFDTISVEGLISSVFFNSIQEWKINLSNKI